MTYPESPPKQSPNHNQSFLPDQITRFRLNRFITRPDACSLAPDQPATA